MNATFFGLEVKRVLRDVVTLFFIAALPGFFYVIFGANQDYSSEPVGNGNVAFYIMTAMGAYGAATATTGVGGMAAVERMQGWGRQLGLTPMSDSGYVMIKTLLAMTIALIPIGITFGLGFLTGAEADASSWALAAVALILGAVLWSLYGLVFGLAFKSEAAVGAASGVLVVLAFLGNVFVPLSGSLLSFAQFTPLYGYVTLARFPQTEGYTIDSEGTLTQVALWVPVANVVVWTLVFALLATWLVRRGRSRQ